jgi:2,5-diketo-D-gluconate reductase B
MEPSGNLTKIVQRLSVRIGVLPRFGFGTWKLNGDTCVNAVKSALDVGYRHIDTAEGYRNEAEVGRAIADSDVPRAEIFLVTKVGQDHLGPGQVLPHVKASLTKLRVSQVDLLLVHWPAARDAYDLDDYMKQFAQMQDLGLTKHIGVANFTSRHIDRALRVLGDKTIATNQVEIHPLMQNRPIVEHCQKLGIPLTAYSPLARGAVGDSAVLKRIGAAHGATPEQIALAFLLAEGHIVIPSSSKKERIVSNLAADAITLSRSEVEEIRAIDEGRRLISGSWAPAWDT